MHWIQKVRAIRWAVFTVSASFSATIVPAYASEQVFGTGRISIATFIGFSAGDTDTVSVTGVGPFNFFTNQTSMIGDTVVLGQFGPDVEIEFQLNDWTQSGVWYTGTAIRNADGLIHASVTTDVSVVPDLAPASYAEGLALKMMDPTILFVGLADRPNPRPEFGYNDLVFAVSNATDSALPEPAPLAFLTVGTVAVALLRRRAC